MSMPVADFNVDGALRLTDWALLRAAGPDAAAFLQSQLTQDVLGLQRDRVRLAGYCSPKGRLLATSANVPAYMGALLSTRLYDVMNGWKPRDAERLMNWRSVTMTKANVQAYLDRYVNNGDVAPFDYKRMSKVLHPNDWDPQAEVFPMDIDREWGGIPQPDGWQYPEAYVKARDGGEAKAVQEEYAAHYKIDFFGPSPMKA